MRSALACNATLVPLVLPCPPATSLSTAEGLTQRQAPCPAQRTSCNRVLARRHGAGPCVDHDRWSQSRGGKVHKEGCLEVIKQNTSPHTPCRSGPDPLALTLDCLFGSDHLHLVQPPCTGGPVLPRQPVSTLTRRSRSTREGRVCERTSTGGRRRRQTSPPFLHPPRLRDHRSPKPSWPRKGDEAIANFLLSPRRLKPKPSTCFPKQQRLPLQYCLQTSHPRRTAVR